MIGNERTRDGGDGGVEERNGGVNEERVPREPKADDPVGRLVKATASDDTQQLLALVENYFEPNRHEPKHQGSQEENPRFVLILRCSSHHSLLSLPFSGHAVHKGSQPLIFLGIQIFSSSPTEKDCFCFQYPQTCSGSLGCPRDPSRTEYQMPIADPTLVDFSGKRQGDTQFLAL